jgi:phosphoribosyl-AMP cyclohydrolase
MTTPGDIETTTRFSPRFDEHGLVTCVVVDAADGAVLMLAHMNADALDRTVETGEAWFWSRSRKALWRKGETSGNTLRVEELLVDCDQDARFLLEEILPHLEKTYKLRKDAEGRAICGISSGGICAFTVAWERPDQFHKVLSHVGSFTSIATKFQSDNPAGHDYPFMIRKAERKSIRVFLQDGSNDLDNDHGRCRGWR